MPTTLMEKPGKFAYMTHAIETIGERIRRCREALELTQQQIATAVGVSAAAVSQWETGDTKTLKSEYIFKVARALGKSAEWLVTGDGPEQPRTEIYDVIAGLPNSDSQQVIDFIQYRYDRAEGLIASEKLAHYLKMIEDFKQDLARRKGTPKPPRGGKTE